MVVSYATVDEFPGWQYDSDLFLSLIREYGAKRILEIGSGANPTLSPASVQAGGLSYVTSDIDPRELEKTHAAFESMVFDLTVSEIDPALVENFDAIFSRMVNEHVRDGRQYHANVFRLLRPGGFAAHCFSTLWSFPFAMNRLLPDFLTDRLLNTFGPRDRHQHEKFKAYYSWSRGPTKAMLRRYEALGYEVIRYTGYFGHNYYDKRFPWLGRFEDSKSRFLARYPIPFFCSYATVVLRKPEVATPNFATPSPRP